MDIGTGFDSDRTTENEHFARSENLLMSMTVLGFTPEDAWREWRRIYTGSEENKERGRRVLR